jgi:hypothetical protein
LYDRGLPTEHYGFYSYFDRSIFLKSVQVLQDGQRNLGNVPADQNGGSTLDSATVRCTWTQTRFRVQIWTNPQNQLKLLSSPSGTSSSPPPSSTGGRQDAQASYYVRPGSFPYPVSIALDRHGGTATEKMIYCYGMDDRGRIIENARKLQLEDRGVGGHLVNPSQGPFENVNGVIDGGTGGCECEWTNWKRKF